MGRATVTTAGDDGDYTLSLDYGTARVNAYIARLQALIVEYESSISDAETGRDDAASQLTLANLSLSAAIESLRVATDANREEREAAVDEATRAQLESQATVDQWANRISRFTLFKANAEAKIAELQALDLTDSKDTWCVDYTTDASGEVATIEINGEQPTILVAPGGEAPADSDGFLLAREAMTPEAAFLNAALLPGWQKYRPTYRLGTLTAIDRQNDTGTVDLDDAASSAQGLDINQAETLEDVPIEYMTCNAAAFLVYDRVVVQFTGQDWEEPKVIGFESEPKPCTGGIVRYLGSPAPASTPWGWIFALYENTHSYLLEELRASFQVTPSVPLADLVLCEFRTAGDSDWIVCPMSNIHFYHAASNTLKQGPLYQGVPGYQPVRWQFDVVYAGTIRPLFDLFDVSGDYFHLVDPPQPPNTSVESEYYYAYMRNMGYAVSNEHTSGGVMVNLRQYNWIEWPDRPGSGTPDEMEIRIRTKRDGRVHMHCVVNLSTYEVYGVQSIDILDDPVPTDFPPSGPEYWEYPGYTPSLMDEYEFAEDGTIWYYNGSGTKINSGLS